MRTPVLLALALLAPSLGRAQNPPAATPVDLSGKSDASILNVLRVVARHQIQPLKDGDYTPVETAEARDAARQPQGIQWNYPWGVTLYGVLRSTDATGDTEARDFVLEHNRIVARYYAWLSATNAKVGIPADLRPMVPGQPPPMRGPGNGQQRGPGQGGPAGQAQVAPGQGAPGGQGQFAPGQGGPGQGGPGAMRGPGGMRSRNAIRGLMVLGNLDNCGAMGVELLEGALRYPDTVTAEEKVVLERVADWIANKQERLPDGTHWRPFNRDDMRQWPAGTVWADDLYMGSPYLVRWAQFTQDGKYLTDAAHQVINMAARLQDTDGMWFHAYSEPKKEHSPCKWGRANGWIMVTEVEILSAMPENHPDRDRLLDIYRKHVAGVKSVQADSGMWRQVLNEKDLWEETSCTAMFAYAIARGVNRGWLPASDMAVARKAFAGICAKAITPEGAVNGTCAGTGIGLNVEFYQRRPRPDDDMHGRGVVLLAGTEILNPKR